MAELEQDILDLGVEIIWVLQLDHGFGPGTAESCRDTMDRLGSSEGWCVGDSETEPESGTFNDSPFAQGRGYDLFVPRDTMEVLWTSNHGTPSGNENLTGEEVLEIVTDLVE